MHEKSICERPLIFGEILFDIFENGNKTLGGAPFNVAWHLQGFGINPIFLSRIGNDPEGDFILNSLKLWELDTTFVQIDHNRPTGKVDVNIKNGHPGFVIRANQSYDFIEPNPDLFSIIPAPKILYHGSLSMRSPKNTNTLSEIIYKLSPYIIADINLRSPWWNISAIESILTSTHTLKLNEDELDEISRSHFLDNIPSVQKVKTLFERYPIESIFVTIGKDGAYVLTRNNGFFNQSPLETVNIIDTVGAGDAFTAVIILGKIYNWKPQITLIRATEFAEKICCVQGAISSDRNLYSTLRKKWIDEDNLIEIC